MQDTQKPRILIIESDEATALAYTAQLSSLKALIIHAASGEEGLKAISRTNPHLIILDLTLPDLNGLHIIRGIGANHPLTKVIVTTANSSIITAVEAMRYGASDFLLKPCSLDKLLAAARAALELRRLGYLVQNYQGETMNGCCGFIGRSPAMQSVYRMISDAALSRASVFVTGESGTGKELCAESLHLQGPRAGKPFIALNCAAIPANLIESEIFGHRRGAFTGATEDRIGAAQKADTGTFFLDEICEMPLDLQSKLLRFIQTGNITPLGSAKPVTLNVRFICATNRNPWDEVLAGRFREDLYYRLHVIPIHLPPLRERGEDIPLLAHSFLEHFSAQEDKNFRHIDAEALEILQSYHWPGNVRELANSIHSAVVLYKGPSLQASMLSGLRLRAEKMLPISLKAEASNSWSAQPSYLAKTAEIEPLAQIERRHIEYALKRENNNIVRAAGKLGLHPSTLYRKISAWEKIQPSDKIE